MLNLNSLEYFNEAKKKNQPNPIEMAYYIFFLHGIPKTEVDKQELPYIFSMMHVDAHMKELERKAMEKNK